MESPGRERGSGGLPGGPRLDYRAAPWRWMGGRVVEGARLESAYTSKAYRGFESHPIRHRFPTGRGQRRTHDTPPPGQQGSERPAGGRGRRSASSIQSSSDSSGQGAR